MTNDPTFGHIIGIVDFNGNSTDIVNIPCGATHISTDPQVDDDRALTFVFTIDP
jgi:hypothetical protein